MEKGKRKNTKCKKQNVRGKNTNRLKILSLQESTESFLGLPVPIGKFLREKKLKSGWEKIRESDFGPPEKNTCYIPGSLGVATTRGKMGLVFHDRVLKQPQEEGKDGGGASQQRTMKPPPELADLDVGIGHSLHQATSLLVNIWSKYISLSV